MALTAKELRIGNYIQATHEIEIDRGNGIIEDSEILLLLRVRGIDEDSQLIDGSCMFSLEEVGTDYQLERYRDLGPIPLTEQWLLDFGFKLDNNGHWWKNLVTHYLELIEMNKWFFPVFVQLPELSNVQEQRVGLPRIGSVHEMQNLFFALTGEELEIKGNAPNSL